MPPEITPKAAAIIEADELEKAIKASAERLSSLANRSEGLAELPNLSATSKALSKLLAGAADLIAIHK